MLIGCVICYNDFPLIKECIESLISKVDKLIVVDGRYKDFPGQGWESTDGTLEYLSGLNIDLISSYNADELGKRNTYLEQLSDGDIVLNLDSDEVLVGNIPELKSDFGIVKLHDGHCGKVQDRATRFFKFRQGIEYQNVHYTLYWQGKLINKLHKVVNPEFSYEYIKDFYIKHNWHLRSDLRKHYKSQYYKKLIKNESGFIK